VLFSLIVSAGSIAVSHTRVGVRAASPLDFHSVVALRRDIAPPGVDRGTRRAAVDVMTARQTHGMLCLLAHDEDGGLFGSLECSTSEFANTRLATSNALYVTEVAVAASARRSGVASALLRKVDDVATLSGIHSVYLHVEAGNGAARRLYRKAGYEELDATPLHSSFAADLGLYSGAFAGFEHLLCRKRFL